MERYDKINVFLKTATENGWEIIYERTRTQYDFITKTWIYKTFYIRSTKGKRNYGKLSGIDKLLLLGIYNHSTNQYQEWAYNDDDQLQLFQEVFLNFVKLKERKRLLKKLENFLETQKHHNLRPYLTA